MTKKITKRITKKDEKLMERIGYSKWRERKLLKTKIRDKIIRKLEEK